MIATLGFNNFLIKPQILGGTFLEFQSSTFPFKIGPVIAELSQKIY
jgi:hypothetical protein